MLILRQSGDSLRSCVRQSKYVAILRGLLGCNVLLTNYAKSCKPQRRQFKRHGLSGGAGLNVGSSLQEWGITAFAALATIAASYIAIRSQRRDRFEDRITKIEDKVNNHDSRLAAVESALEWIRKFFRQE